MKNTILILITILTFSFCYSQVTNEKTYYNSGELWTECEYRNGVRNGVLKTYLITGTLNSIGEFTNGKKSGIWKYFFTNGILKSQARYADDKYEGTFSVYFDNGKLLKEGKYSNDTKIGLWKEYYKNGNLAMSGEYAHYYRGQALFSRKVGLWEQYHDNGQLSAVGKFNDKGEQTGIWKNYHNNGQLYLLGEYNNKGETTGIWKTYDKAGQLTAEDDKDFDKGVSYFSEEKYKEAEALLILSSERENSTAQYFLGGLYNSHLKEFIKARYWYGKSAKNGYVDSFHVYALMLMNDEYGAVDKKEARYWYQKAAENANEDSYFLLGTMYLYEEYGTIDKEKAIYWLEKSGSNGKLDAYINLGSLYIDFDLEFVNEMNGLGTTETDNKRYDELTILRKKNLKKALISYEKAYSLEPSEELEGTINSIKGMLKQG